MADNYFKICVALNLLGTSRLTILRNTASFSGGLYGPGLTNLWHACPKRHPSFTAAPIFFFFSRPSSPYCEYTHTHTHIHTSDCVQTVYELPLLPNNTAVKHFYTNRERCEVLTGYLSLGRRPGGEWANT